MRIEKLQTQNIKGRSLTLDFKEPVTVITGQNFAGKTSALDAITLALCGYHPVIGRKPGDIMGIASSTTMTTAVTFSDGTGIERSWKSKGGKASGEVCFTGRNESDWKMPNVLLDAEAYFGLSDRERVKFVFGLMPMPEAQVNGNSIAAKVRAIKLDTPTEQSEAVITELCDAIKVSDEARHREGQPLHEWIEELCADMRERKLTADRAIRQDTAAVRSLTEQREESQQEPVSQTIDVEVQESREKIEQLVKQVTTLKSEQTAAGARERRKDEIKRMLATMPTDELIANLTEKLRTAVALQGDYKSRTQGLAVEIGKAKHELQALNTRINELQRKMKELHRQFEAQPCCPNCGWKAISPEDHAKQLRDTEADTIAAILERDALKGRIESNLEQDFEDAKQADVEHEKSTGQVIGLRTELAMLKGKSESVTNLNVELAGLNSMQVVDYAGAIRDQEDTLSNLRAGLTKMEGEQRRGQTIRAEKQAREQAIERAQRMEAEAAILKEVCAMLDALQAAIVTEAFTAVLETANSLAAPILVAPLHYRDGEIGMIQGRTWVPHRTFSGTEKAIAYAAICLALGAQSPIKLVMIDELGRLETQNKIALVKLAMELVKAGKLDQFIGVDLDPAPYDGCHVITL